LISIICKSRRPELWIDFYNQFFTTKVNFEIIFIGPFKPAFELPKYCRFIHTIVKPAQCTEIGFRKAKGDYLVEFADDIKSKNKKILENIKNFLEKQKNNYFLLSHQLYSYGDKVVIPNKKFNNLILPFSPVFSKKIFSLTKGVDSNFIAVFHEPDLYLRLMQLGCKVIFSNIIFEEKKRPMLEPTLYGDYAKVDGNYFESVWTLNKKFSFKKKRKISPFKNFNITILSQGPQGKWKYKSFILFYIMQSNFKNKILKILRLDFPLFHRIYYSNKNNFLIKRLSRIIKYLFY
jgi:hypothetical protein